MVLQFIFYIPVLNTILLRVTASPSILLINPTEDIFKHSKETKDKVKTAHPVIGKNSYKTNIFSTPPHIATDSYLDHPYHISAPNPTMNNIYVGYRV